MSGISVKSTPYQKTIDSTPVKFAKDNPGLAVAGIAGVAVIGKQVVDKSEIAATVIKKGAIPVLGAGAVALGGVMIHDAIVNDLKDNKVKAGAKIGGGTALIAGGTEAVGRSIGVKALQPLSMAKRALVDNANTLGFTVYAAAGTGVAVAAAINMKKNGVTVGNSLALTGGASAALGSTSMVAWEAAKQTETLGVKVLSKSAKTALGAGLALSSYALGKKAKDSFSEGKTGVGAVAGIASATALAASVHVLGNATGIEALSNLGQKVFMKNPLMAGAITATGLAAGGLYLYSQDKLNKK